MSLDEPEDDDPELARQAKRLTEEEVRGFFDRMFPHGVDGADVLNELAPDGWQQSPLSAADADPRQLIGLCLWDVFSDNHNVGAADGRWVDIGTFRGASTFLDNYLFPATSEPERLSSARFYMGTHYVWRLADLTPIYLLIFRRLHALGADWFYDGADRQYDDPYIEPVPWQNPHPNEPLPILIAYREVFGRNPPGWPYA